MGGIGASFEISNLEWGCITMGGRGASYRGGWRSPMSGSFELPELSGSVKQVKWASDIRQGAVDALESMKAYNEKMRMQGLPLYYNEKSLEALFAELKTATSTVTDASKWIDRRSRFTFTALEIRLKKIEHFGVQKKLVDEWRNLRKKR
jgi:hypothetical protein